MVATITIDGFSVQENSFDGNQLEYVVTLSEAVAQSVTVAFRTFSDYPTFAGSDYTASSGTLTFAPGETSKTILVNDVYTSNDEVDEPITVELYAPVNADLPQGVAKLRETAFLLDADGGADRALSVSSPVVNEGDGGRRFANFTVKLSEASEDVIQLDYTTADGTATAGADFVAQSGTLTFGPGQTEQVVEVRLSADEIFEGAETFNLVVTPTSAIASGGHGAVGTATILDNDAALPILSVDGFSTIESSFDGQRLEYVVTLSEPADGEVSINYRSFGDFPSFAGSDHTAVSGTLTFAPGETVKVIQVNDVYTSNDEVDEAITLEFYEPNGIALPDGVAKLRETAFVYDADGGANRALSVSSPVMVEGDTGDRTAVFSVKLSFAADEAITLDYTTMDATAEAGRDYEATAGRVTFEPGQVEAFVTVPLTADTKFEAAETFDLVVTPNTDIASGGTGAVGTATILDDDGPGALPSLSVESYGTVESSFDGQQVEYVITLSEASDQTVMVDYKTVNGQAQVGSDYAAADGTLTFAPGETVKVVKVTDVYTSNNEADESVILELFQAENAVLPEGASFYQDAAFLYDADGGVNLAAEITDVEVQEGTNGPTYALFNVTLSRAADTALTFEYSTFDGTARAGRDYVQTQGEVEFAPGQTEAWVEVEILGDYARESLETFSLSMVNPLPFGVSELFAGASGTASIVSDDVVGTRGKDVLEGTRGADGIYGLAGRDVITGGAGPDRLYGDAGRDVISGGKGNDWFVGGKGEDTAEFADANGVTVDLSTTSGQITGQGRDLFRSIENVNGSDGADAISGSDIDNVLKGRAGDDALDGKDGDDRLLGEAGDDTLSGGADNDSLEGGDGDDTANGNGGNDFVHGNGGDDMLVGAAGADTLIGGNGADTIAAGSGRDVVTGGNGPDVFVFTDETQSRNTITDFNPRLDMLRLEGIALDEVAVRSKGDDTLVDLPSGLVILEGRSLDIDDIPFDIA